MTNREYVQKRGEEMAQIAYERNLASGFTPEQASALSKDAELQGRHLARRELGIPTSPRLKPATAAIEMALEELKGAAEAWGAAFYANGGARPDLGLELQRAAVVYTAKSHGWPLPDTFLTVDEFNARLAALTVAPGP